MSAAGTDAGALGDLERRVRNDMPSWPSFEADERAAVQSVLLSGCVNYWTGDQTRQFEREYATAFDLRHAIALMNGSVALELPLRMWGIGPSDEVIVTPRSFIASTSCVVLQGARPVFAEVDRDSGNITASSIERILSPRTKAIIPVHLGGWPCEMDDIMALANIHGVKVVEDCAQAHGATYKGRNVGAIGHAAAFSFCQDKIITTGGEGGLIATDDEELWSRAWAFKDHGKSYDAVYKRAHPPGFRWLHESFGTNLRMTELQAAIGRIQLRKLPQWNEQRTVNARALHAGLASVPGLRIPMPPHHSRHAYYRFYAYIETAKLRSGWSRDRVISEVAQRGVPCFSGTCSEVYREKAFERTSFAPKAPLPIARELGESSLALLVHPTLNAGHMARAVEAVRDVMTAAVR
jgi:dTDP-4-amino-4,6-dideoxygalactose transaminase